MTDYPDLFASPIVGVDPAAVFAAVDVVRSYCRWHIAPSVEDDTVTLDGSGSSVLLLPSLHVTAVTSVVEDGTTLAADAFQWSENGVLEKGCWTRKRRGVVVTFTHGYIAGPLALRAIVTRLAKSGIAGRAASVQVGQVRVTNSPDQAAGVIGLDYAASAVLDRYRIFP